MASTSGSSNDRSGGGPSEEKTVICSICLEVVETSGPKDSVRLRCGHLFHFDCITTAFSAKGRKECPNCRDVTGNWSITTTSDQERLHQMQVFLTDFIGMEREMAEQDQANWDARVQEQEQTQENEWQVRMQELVRSQERMRAQIAHERARISQYWTAHIEQERAHTAQYLTLRIEQERARIAQYYSTIYGRTSLPPNSVLSNSFIATPPYPRNSTSAPSWLPPPPALLMATRPPSFPTISVPLSPFMRMPAPAFRPMSPTTAFESSSSTEPAIATAVTDSRRVPDDDVEAEDPLHN